MRDFLFLFAFCKLLLDSILVLSKSTVNFEFQVTFYMVGDNATVVRHRLEEILVERKKFICLNDDMTNPEIGVSLALHEFFEAYYPRPSPYVLN